MRCAGVALVVAFGLATACRSPSPPPPPTVANVKAGIDPTAWIAKLDTVSGSWFELDKQPVIVALLAADADAVEPLIDVLEKDRRTSKLVYDRERDFDEVVQVPVYRIAFWLLQRLIDTSYFVSANAEMRMARDEGARKTVAAELRAEWTRWGRRSRAERWYATLADDHAKPELWMDAAAKIFEWVPSRHLYDVYDVADDKPLQGEALRGHARPTVTELVTTRVRQLGRHDACELVRLLGRWDRAATLQLGARLMRDAIAASGTTAAESRCIWMLAVVRWKLGEPAALDDYAAWIANITPPTDDYWPSGLFDPMIDNSTRPSMVKAADTLFGAGSPWLPFIPDAPGRGVTTRTSLLESRIYWVPAFRRYVLTELADQHVLGTVDTRAGGGWGYQLANGMNMSTSARDDDTFPQQPVSLPLRACDFYAYFLGQQDQAPKFSLFWDQARRDRAIVELDAWLRTFKP